MPNQTELVLMAESTHLLSMVPGKHCVDDLVQLHSVQSLLGVASNTSQLLEFGLDETGQVLSRPLNPFHSIPFHSNGVLSS